MVGHAFLVEAFLGDVSPIFWHRLVPPFAEPAPQDCKAKYWDTDGSDLTAGFFREGESGRCTRLRYRALSSRSDAVLFEGPFCSDLYVQCWHGRGVSDGSHRHGYIGYAIHDQHQCERSYGDLSRLRFFKQCERSYDFYLPPSYELCALDGQACAHVPGVVRGPQAARSGPLRTCSATAGHCGRRLRRVRQGGARLLRTAVACQLAGRSCSSALCARANDALLIGPVSHVVGATF